MTGDIRVLYINEGVGGYKPLGCLTSNEISEEVKMVGTTTRRNQGWRTSIPTVQSGSIAFSAFYKSDSDASRLDYFDLINLKRDKVEFFYIIRDPISDLYIERGRGVLTSLEKTSNSGELITYSGTIKIQGKPE